MRLLKKDYDFLEINKENINLEINRLKSEIEELKKEKHDLLNKNEIIKTKQKNQEFNLFSEKIVMKNKDYENINLYSKKVRKTKKEYNSEEIKEHVINKCPVYVYKPINYIEEEASKFTLKLVLHYVDVYKKILAKIDNNPKLISKEIDKLVIYLLEENKYKNTKSNKYKYRNILIRCAYLKEIYKNKLECCKFNVNYIGAFSEEEWYIWLEYFNSLI